MNVNKYLPFAFIYFFVNSLGLPWGLTYTSLLAPFFYVWILLTRKKDVLLPFLALLTPFILAHLFIVGVDTKSYFISALNLVLVYIFSQAVYTFLKQCHDVEKILKAIFVVNFAICLLAIPLYFTPYAHWLWIEQELSAGVTDFKRLNMFTYEASYYALMFSPVFFFFLLQYFFGQNKIHPWLLLPMLFLPYVLSFSLGVIGAAILAGIIIGTIYFTRLTSKRRILNMTIYAVALFAIVLVVMILFFRHNPIFQRFDNILTGEDTSGKGRTADAFIIAGKLLSQGNEYWGIGLGQIKLVGDSIIRNYYLYYHDVTVTIPNATAETLTIFGIIGLVLRLSIEIFFFVHTKVWTNYYRFLLFLFIFIYQFTGSFITNGVEYVIWILAFTNVFPQFNVEHRERNPSLRSG